MSIDTYFETKSERKLEWSFVTGLYLQLTMKSQHLQKPTVLWGNLNVISLQYSINWILNRYGSIMLCTWLLTASNAFECVNSLSHLFRYMKKNVVPENSHLGWFEVKIDWDTNFSSCRIQSSGFLHKFYFGGFFGD